MPPALEQKGELGFVMPYGDSPMDKESVGELVYMDILDTAKRYVHIMTPFFTSGFLYIIPAHSKCKYKLLKSKLIVPTTAFSSSLTNTFWIRQRDMCIL